MSIIINSLDDYNNINKPDITIIIKVGADWCAPCKSISPFYKLLASNNNNPNIIYAEINTSNAHDDLLDYINIKSLPTFIFYKNNVILNKIIGCDNILLSKYIDTL
jgi:thiol-disulfide isomerase/thioredoxin